jgi:XapX domain-containing protein
MAGEARGRPGQPNQIRGTTMSFMISLGAGFAVGLLYFLARVQSPAPPLIALAGLLGIVMGEHAIPVVRTHLFPASQQAQPLRPSSASTETAAPEEVRK